MARARELVRAPAVGRRRASPDGSGRERLLDAAIALFAERGIASTTLAQIAAAGEVTAAMVHYWFETRDKLQDAIVEERIAPLLREVWASADPGHGDVIGMVRGLVRRMLDVTERTPWLPALWLREIVQEGGLLRERMLKRAPLERMRAFRASVARAQARGEVHPGVAPDLLFLSMLALVMLPQAVARTWRRVNPEAVVDRASLERHVLALVMDGLTAPARAHVARRRT
jgi:AcrR family transcriptional regulator